MDLDIRLMQKSDLDFALAQTAREGWDIPPGGFELHLEHDGRGCFIAQRAARRVGMITTARYDRSAFIGNLIVDPAHRRQGIGEALMRRAMDGLREEGFTTLLLEADAPGVKLYRRLGFVDVFNSLRFELHRPAEARSPNLRPSDSPSPGPRSHGPDDVCPLTTAQLLAIAPYDARQFGDNRAWLFAAMLQQAPAAFWIDRSGQTAGYLMTQRIPGGWRLGPWVADDADAAERLLDAALAAHPGGRLTAGFPDANGAAVALLEAHGFQRREPCLRMRFGESAYDEHPQRIFGIVGGDRG